MLATQLNDIMKNGTIGRNAIICLKKYICNVVPTPPGRAPPANGRYAPGSRPPSRTCCAPCG